LSAPNSPGQSTFEERLEQGLLSKEVIGDGILPFPEDWGEDDLAICLKRGQVRDEIFERLNSGWPLTLYRYRLMAGTIIQIVLRLDNPAAPKKYVRPLRVQRLIGSRCEVVALAHCPPRPLYGLDRLAAASTESEVLLVEGEKAADAGQRVFPGMPVITWSNGAQGQSVADFTPLAGRRVIIWPDNDSTGATATKTLGPRLIEIGAQSVRVVQVPDWFPDKWDLAEPFPVPHG
jgi:hypothetical protein